MIRFFFLIAALCTVIASAHAQQSAGLCMTWPALTVTDTGEPLADFGATVGEYRVYECGAAQPLAIVDGAEVSYCQAGVITSTGAYCRELSAFIAPFEGGRVQGVFIAVRPGQAGFIQFQPVLE